MTERQKKILEDLENGIRRILSIHLFKDDGYRKLKTLVPFLEEHDIICDLSDVSMQYTDFFRKKMPSDAQLGYGWKDGKPYSDDITIMEQIYHVFGIIRVAVTNEELEKITKFGNENGWRSVDLEKQTNSNENKYELLARDVARKDIEDNVSEEQCHSELPQVGDEFELERKTYFDAYYDERMKLVGVENCTKLPGTEIRRASELRGTYDVHSDVLYITIGEPRTGFADETPSGIYVRKTDDGKEEIFGATILGYSNRNFGEMVLELSKILNVNYDNLILVIVKIVDEWRNKYEE